MYAYWRRGATSSEPLFWDHRFGYANPFEKPRFAAICGIAVEIEHDISRRQIFHDILVKIDRDGGE